MVEQRCGGIMHNMRRDSTRMQKKQGSPLHILELGVQARVLEGGISRVVVNEVHAALRSDALRPSSRERKLGAASAQTWTRAYDRRATDTRIT